MNRNFQSALGLVAALQAASARPSSAGPNQFELARELNNSYKANRYGPAPKRTEGDDKRLSGGKKSWLDGKLGALKYLVPAVGLADDIVNDETGQSPASRIIDVLSRGNYASANAFKTAQDTADAQGGELSLSDFISSLGKGAVEGATGREKTVYSDLLKQNNPDGNRVAQGVGGFALDVLGDPLTYIPVAGVASALGKAGKAAKGTKKAIDSVDATKPLPKPDVEALALSREKFSDKMGLPAAPSRPTISVGGEGVAEIIPASRFDRPKTGTALPGQDELDGALYSFDENTSKLAAAAYASTLDQLSKLKDATPRRKYSRDLQVDNLYETMIDRVKTGQVTREVTEDVTEDVVTNQRVKLSPEEMRLTAIKQALLDDDNYRITHPKSGKIYTVGQIKAAAQQSPEGEKFADTFLNIEARRIASGEKEADLPEIGIWRKTDGTGDRTGSTTADALIRALQGQITPPKGSIKAPKGADKYGEEFDAARSKFLLHSPEDAETLFLKNTKGEKLSIKSFLESVTSRPVTRQEVRQVTRQITEDAFESKIWDQRKNFQEWKAQYADVFSPEELTYIGKASNKKAFETRLNNVLNQKVKDAPLKWDDFFQYIRDGKIDADDMQEMMRLTGAKSPAGLEKQVRALISKWEKSSTAALKPEPKPKVDRFKAGEVPDTQWETPKSVAKSLDGLARRSNESENKWIERVTEEMEGRGFSDSEIEDFLSTGKVTPHEVIKQVEAEELTLKPEDIIDAVEAGDESIFIRDVPQLPEADIPIVLSALDEAVKKNLEIPLDVKQYPFETLRTRAKRTSSTPGKGFGRHVNGWNSYAQSDQFRGIMRGVSADLKADIADGAVKKGADRASAAYDRVMGMLDAVATITRKAGVEPVVGPAQRGYPLSSFDVLSALPRPVVEKFLLNRNLSVWPSKLLDSAYVVLREANGEIPLGNAKRVIIAGLTTPSSQKKLVSPIAMHKASDRLMNEFADAMIAAKPALVELANKNTARLSLENGAKLADAVKVPVEQAAAAMRDPAISHADAARAIREIPKEAKKRASKSTNGNKQVEAAAEQLAKAEVRKFVTPQEEQWIKYGDQIATSSSKEKSKLTAKQQGILLDEIDEAYPAYDLGEKAEIAFNEGLTRRLYPIIKRFNTHFGNAKLRPEAHALENRLQTEAHMFRKSMQQLHDIAYKKYPASATGVDPAELIRTAFRTLQSGDVDNIDGPVLELMQNLDVATKNMLSQMPDVSGVTANQLNRWLRMKGVKEEYFIDPAKPIEGQWRNWENVDNPLDLLDRYNAGVLGALTEITVAADFSARFGKTSPFPGSVRIVDRGGKSIMASLIDSSLYYPKEMAQQLHVMDDALTGTTMLENMRKADGKFSKWLEFHDSLIQAYKTGLTIYRPGHHVRNFVGDASLSFLAGVNNPMYYGRAGAVLKTRGKYTGFTGLDELRKVDTSTFGGTDGKVVARVKLKGGQKVALTDDEVYRMAHKEGLLVDYSTLEDTAYTSAVGQDNIFMKLREKSLFKGKVHNAAAGLSQLNAHLARTAHLLHILEHGSYRSIDDAFKQAGDLVRKWHPDGSDLTKFQHDYMRRGFMFYSWVRKAIPLVLEATLMQPGRVVMFPKAQYNFAVSMGIDPESLSNPFPDDQLFPDFMTSEINGPQFEVDGKYYGLNPGYAVNDIYNQFIQKDGWRGFAGTLNPLARIPVETATGVNLGLGTRISDKSDYVDSQIPGVSNIANMANRSVSGLGQPKSNNVEYVNGRRQVVESFDPNKLSMLNLLTGLGARDMSKPNYIKRAEIDERDRLRRQQ